VERGVVGSLPVLVLLVSWAVLLARTRPGADSGEADFLVWGASFSGWLVVVAAGLINTTLHHEHGLLAAVLLGMHLAHFRRTSRPEGT
jgi:hypothetical protein